MTKQHSVIITWQPRQEKKNIKCLLHFAHSELYPKRQHNEKNMYINSSPVQNKTAGNC